VQKGDLVRLTRPGQAWHFEACLGIIVDKDAWATTVRWFIAGVHDDAEDITNYTPYHGWKVEVVSGKR
jgi:hypothetical protein